MGMTANGTWEAIRDFAAAECGVPADRLTPETTLLGNLGVDGDDAVELFEASRGDSASICQLSICRSISGQRAGRCAIS